MKRVMVIGLCLVLAASLTSARKVADGNHRAPRYVGVEIAPNVSDRDVYPVQAAPALAVTTYLAYYSFDDGVSCDPQGWTSVDYTAQPGVYFHVTDFVTPPEDCGPGGGGLMVPQGAQALWCGACPSDADPLCAYYALPGYGNGWNQAFCSPCVSTGDTIVTVDYYVRYDSEPGYDRTTLEFDACDGVFTAETSVNGGTGFYEGGGGLFESIQIKTTGLFSLRFHFTSDGAWSDADGLWDSDGAVILDSLTVRDGGGILIATETFEDEALGSTSATDWTSCARPGYGDLAELTKAVPTTYQNDPVQEDPCASNFTCLWTFFKNSTYNYACNTPDPSPQQMVVPYGNTRGQYASTTIFSPWIPLAGSGSVVDLEFDVYRDLKLDALVFYNWMVRSKVGENGCPSGFRNFDPIGYYGSSKDWLRRVHSIGSLIPDGATHIQIGLGVSDMCPLMCGLVGTGNCHSHGPMFDNVEIYRVHTHGPQFSLRDINMFQDNFSTDGTTTGKCRADMAQDILSSYSPGIIPGDSVTITASDPEVGLATDLSLGGPAVYCFISVDPARYPPMEVEASEQRSGAGYSGDIRFPYAGTISAAGRTWDYFRMDSSFTRNGGLRMSEYCIDFNDDLFVPGDTCWFFFGAKNATGEWNYCSLPYGRSHSMNVVAGAPDEFTMLPAVGDEPGNDILYVDGYNFGGAQPFFDTAFENMNLSVDRYDVRGPSYGAGNRLASRVRHVQQISPPVYSKIIWNTGDLALGCIGDGVSNEKSDDATLLYTWIDHLPTEGGIYFSGDDLADEWIKLYAGAVLLRTGYCNFTVLPDHAAAELGINPKVLGVPGGVFSHSLVGDSLIAYGGCPSINDFDVLAEIPPLSVLEAWYVEDPDYAPINPTTGGAIVSQTTVNSALKTVRVILSGFSYHYIRDIDTDGITDRYHHLHDIITSLSNTVDDPIAAPPATRRNFLAQNYPNPFNPVTTIAYSLKDRAHVSLKVYNVAGQLVCTLVDEVQGPETVKPVEWRGLNDRGQQVASGVYFYRLVTKGYTKTRKMVLLK